MQNNVIRTANKDRLAIVLECQGKLDPCLKSWLEIRVQGTNNLSCICVDSIYSSLGGKVCKVTL